MSQALINQTLTGINQTIEDVLDEYPAHPYQAAFSIPELRQQLITHILNQAPDRQVAAEAPTGAHLSQARDCSRIQARLRMEMFVRGSILHILRENADWLNRHLSTL
jgi:hypothetical protein